MLRVFLPLALIATAGVAYAQTTPAPAPMTPAQQTLPGQTMSTSPTTPDSVDANGQPIVGRNDWVRQPGDRQGAATPAPGNPDMAAAPPARPRMSGASQPGPDGTFRDEYGFRYDAQGNRIDARGRIMAPPMSRQ